MKFCRFIKTTLRRPMVILGEIAALAAAGALGAALPEWRVFQSVGFTIITLLAAASLIIVVAEQIRRVRSQWFQPLTPAHFQSAPFKVELDRPATGENAFQKIWSARRAGIAGSLVFHVGLLLLIAAGAWRALFASEGAMDLLEGETLAARTTWMAQWPGVLGNSFRLDQPVTLESVHGARYADGNLRELRATISGREIAVNQQLKTGGSRLYLAQEFGPAALLEWNSARRDAVLLADQGGGRFSAEANGPDGLKICLRTEGERREMFDVRVLRGHALLAAGSLGVGQTMTLSDGLHVTLQGAPIWARLHGSHDSALWLAYLGMLLTMAGAAMMFCLIKLDFCVVVTPTGDSEKVFLALKPQRFSPLFQERFEEFVRSQVELKENGRSKIEASVHANNLTSILNPQSSAMARTVGLFSTLIALAVTMGCDRVSHTDAKKLVERYNQVVSEAYRRGDVKLIDPVVGPNEGRKLTGLIGARLDMGITLDSQLRSLEVLGFEHCENILRVRTKESWSYRDLKIGTGEQVGQASQDLYEMNYVFTNVNHTWLVDEIAFAVTPQVGRTNTPWVAEHSVMHGVTLSEGTP